MQVVLGAKAPGSNASQKHSVSLAVVEVHKQRTNTWRKNSECELTLRQITEGRERELAPGSLEEKEDLEDALYALRALRTGWQHAVAG